MRIITVTGLLAITVGCAQDQLAYQSTLYERTRGVAMTSDGFGGSEAQVGMAGTTCKVEPSWATLGSDYDYPSSSETVQDSATINGQDVVVITADDKVYIQQADAWSASESDEFTVEGVAVDAVAVQGGAIVIAQEVGEVRAQWVGPTIDGSTDLPAASYAGTFDLTADPTTGAGFIGSGAGIYQVHNSGTAVQITEQASEIVEFDATTGLLYAAALRGTVIRGLNADGSEVWATDVGGAILSIDDMGNMGQAAVSVEYASGAGAIVVLDGWTGALANSVATPTAASEIKASPDGRSFALVDGDQVHFYGSSNWWDSFTSDLDDDSIDFSF